MRKICDYCIHAETHGYPPEGSPDWEVGTVYFWCAKHEDHEFHYGDCIEYEHGKPRRYDKQGKLMRDGVR